MKITSGGEARGVRIGGAKRTSEKSGATFSRHLGDGPNAAAARDGAAGVGSVAALLAVQAAGDALDGRKAVYDRADNLLKRLEALHMALIEGRIGDAQLRRLAADLNRQIDAVADPEMLELMAQIELRAAVELAKRGLD